jgi:hypothetical protein
MSVEPKPEASDAWEEVLARLRSAGRPRVLKSPAGLWADLGIDISPEDITQAREEMWVFRADPWRGQPDPD